MAISARQILALKAVVHGCAKNERLVGGRFLIQNAAGEWSSDPEHNIPFREAMIVVAEFISELENGGLPDESTR